MRFTNGNSWWPTSTWDQLLRHIYTSSCLAVNMLFLYPLYHVTLENEADRLDHGIFPGAHTNSIVYEYPKIYKVSMDNNN